MVNGLWYHLYDGTDDGVNEFSMLFYKYKRTNSQDSNMNNLINSEANKQ